MADEPAGPGRAAPGTATVAARASNAEAFLQGGGELGALIRAKDWSRTPLGPPENWPQSLKTTLGILLNSRYPMFVFWGPELIKIYNDAYRPITGHKHPWALGRPAREVWPEIWSDIEPLVARALAGDPTYSDDLMLFMERSGFREEVYFTFSYSPVPDESGGVGGMFCACTETTARVLSERRLRTLRDLAVSPADARTVDITCVRSTEVLAASTADIPFAVIYLRQPDGGVRLVASTGVAAGDAAAPVEGAGIDAIWPIARVVETGTAELVTGLAERIGVVPAGPWPEPPPAAMVLPLADRGLGRNVGAIVLGVSARRPFDAEYRRWFELLASQISGLIGNARAAEDDRQRAEALAELDRAKTTFFSNVSHEFRTPLALMLGPIEQALTTDGLPAESRQHLEVARRNSQRLLKLVNTLLDFSRIEAGRLQANQEPVDLGTLTADIASVFRSTIESAGLTFTVDCPPLDEPVAVDREMWEKVVLNLLSNAFKFTLDGAIVVTVCRDGGMAVLTVRDTGTGIAADELPHLFERFHRVRGAGGRSFEGSGIGLALVRELVRLHRGDVHVESAPGQGSTFRVTIPVQSVSSPPHAATAAPALRTPDAGPASQAAAMVAEASRWLPASAGTEEPAGATAARPRIVVADDNADMRDYVAGLLAPANRVEAVGDGMAALDALRREPADLLLADVMMPRLDGLELLRTIRADAALRQIPVIFVSARAGEEARVAGIEAGADDYLLKPFGARELIARVGAALELARVRRTSEERLARANRELRDRVTELETLLAVIPVGIGIALDPECRNVQVNPAFATTLGLSTGQNASMTAPDSERPTSFRVLDMNGRELSGDELPLQVAAREGRTVNDLELDIVHDDGRIVRLLEYTAPLFDEHGRSRGAVGAFVDVTERRRAEVRDSFLVALDDALRAPDDPAAIMSAALRLLATRLDADRGAYADVEADGESLHRPARAHVQRVGRIPRRHLVAVGLRRPGRARAPGRRHAGRARRRRRAGPGHGVHGVGIGSSIVASTLRDGRLVAMIAVDCATPRTWRPEEIELVEITANRCWESIARARAARVIEASERRYRVVADAMPQLVWTADAEGVIDYYSARARAYYGIEVGSWQPMVHPDDLLPSVAAWERALRDQTPYAFEHRLRMADGHYRWHLSRAEPIPPTGGPDDRVRWIGTATDVHELRVTQERLRVQEEQLRDVDRRKDEFIAILAHELRNPLAPLRTGLDVLRLSHDAAGAVARVRPMMERQVTQMVRLIDDLLDVSRITSGKIQLQPEPTLVAQLVRDAMEGHRAALDAGRLSAQVALPPEPVYVYADHARFVQILSNLLHNAIKFTDPGGAITITGGVTGTDRQGHELRLSISDSGAGIAADALPHIFELFAQGHQPAGLGRVGLGIGLALARRLAELHGGRLEAHSDGPGRGATFTLTVPTMPLDLGDTLPDRRVETSLDLSGCRIVVVDDNRDAADALALILGSSGADVRIAYDGDSGLQLIQSFQPDAALLDIGMPGTDGYTVCRRIRETDPDRRIILVALTGFGQAHDRSRALTAGFDSHLTKPADVAALHAALAHVCPQRRP